MIVTDILIFDCLLLFFSLIIAYTFIFCANSNVDKWVAVVAVSASLFLLISIGTRVANPSIEDCCEKESISYTAVSTIAKFTGIDEKTVYNAMEIGRDNEYDLDIVIKYLDPNLTEEEVSAIILTCAMADRNTDNKVIEEP